MVLWWGIGEVLAFLCRVVGDALVRFDEGDVLRMVVVEGVMGVWCTRNTFSGGAEYLQ